MDRIIEAFTAAVRFLHSVMVWLIAFLSFILVGNILLPFMLLFVKNQKRLFQIIFAFWGRIMLLLAGISLQAEGMQNFPSSGSLLIIPNHQGHWDYPILFSVIPRHFIFMIKKELREIPIFGRTFKIAGYIPVDREGRMSIHRAMEKVAQALERGKAVVVFPEGTRSWDGGIGEFKPGAFLLAIKLGVPIVPVAIAGSFSIMRRHTWQIFPRQVKVKIGEVVKVEKHENVGHEYLKKVMNQVHGEIEKMQAQLNLPAK